MVAGFREISAADYHADKIGEIPTLSHGCAVTLVNECPEHAFNEHPRFGAAEREATDGMDFGSAAHELILGKGQGIAVFEGKSWAGKEAGAFWDRAVAQGMTPLKLADFKRAEAVRAAFMAKLHAYPEIEARFAAGVSEQAMVWNEGAVWCRALCDRLCINEDNKSAIIFDVKTCASAHPMAIEKQMGSMGYNVQADFYSTGLRTLRPDLSGRIRFVFLFIEKKPPFSFVPCEMTGEGYAVACSKTSRAISLWRECTAQNRWPGYCSEVLKIEPKPWELASEIGAESLGEKMANN
jgi:hypothetical protein